MAFVPLFDVQGFIQNMLNSYVEHRVLVFMIIFVFFALLSRLMATIVGRFMLRLAKHTKTTVDDEIIRRGTKPLSYLIFIFGSKLSMIPLKTIIPQTVLNFANIILNSVCIFIVSYIVIIIFDVIIEEWSKTWAKKTNSSMDEEILPLFQKFSKVLWTIIAILVVLSLWGVSIGPFLASLGIAGVAIGFAVQDTLKNIFGGVSLILDKNFKVDDVIKLQSGISGKIYDIGLRSTRILNFDNEMMIIPNGELANSTITNYAQPEARVRLQIDFGVEYGSDIEQIRQVVLGAVNKIPNILKQPSPFVIFNSMGDFALNFTVYAWVNSYTERFDTKNALNQAIYESLNAEGIGIPFPTRKLYVATAADAVKESKAMAAKQAAIKKKYKLDSKKSAKLPVVVKQDEQPEEGNDADSDEA